MVRAVPTSGAGPGPSDLPAGERERLAGRGDRDVRSAMPERRQRDVLTVEHEVLVDLVGDGEDVALDADAGDGLELVAAEHLPGGVVGRVEEQETGAVADRGCQLVDVDRPVRRGQRASAATLPPWRRRHGTSRRPVRTPPPRRPVRTGRAGRRRGPRWRRPSPAPRDRDRARCPRTATGGGRSHGGARGSRARAGTGCARPGWRRWLPPRPRADHRCPGTPGRG